eukprot:TRINITY_DN31501_c0_g1_i1.p1 TRINITY_DN31501_c0_g1~~TRINITY_DN31501_c0_g1_i1.p1  ORF type:complete len:183 (+),score=30.50 TRINITY_DN31501_c0_g1_i1:122-670(+)
MVGYCYFFFFQAEDGIRDVERSRGLGDVYKRQVSTQSTWGQNAAKPLDEFVLHDLPREEDRPISSDDGDFIFYGATNGNDNLLSTNSFFLTLVFGLLCLVSFTFSSETGSDSTGVSTERGLKSLYSGEGILWKLKNWVLNPYLLLATYIIIMGIMIFRRDRGFLSSKSKQWIRRIKSHSKTN